MGLLLVTLLALLGGIAAGHKASVERDVMAQQNGSGQGEYDEYGEADDDNVQSTRPTYDTTWAQLMLRHDKLITWLLRIAIDDGNGIKSLSPAQMRNRMLATALLLGLEVASESEAMTDWMRSALQGAWSGVSASAHSGNNLVVLTDPRRQNAKALPALSRSAVANNSAVSYSAIRVGDDMETAALMGRWTGQTILATYENMLAHLRTAADSGKTPLGDHPTGQDWGGSPDLRAIMSTFKEFTPEMAVLTTVLELLFSRSAPLIQYALTALIWMSDASTSTRQTIVNIGAAARIMDLCRVSDDVPRHVSSLALTLALSLADDDANQIVIAPLALPVVVELIRSRVLDDAWEDRAAACWLLETLKEHPQNRTAFFKVELGIKGSISLNQPVERGSVRLHNRMQARVQSAWTDDLSFMSAESMYDGCGARAASPFLQTAEAHPFPHSLSCIMQGRFVAPRPLAPTEGEPPRLYKPQPLPAPLPSGHTIPVENDGDFGAVPPEPIELCVCVTET